MTPISVYCRRYGMELRVKWREAQLKKESTVTLSRELVSFISSTLDSAADALEATRTLGTKT